MSILFSFNICSVDVLEDMILIFDTSPGIDGVEDFCKDSSHKLIEIPTVQTAFSLVCLNI